MQATLREEREILHREQKQHACALTEAKLHTERVEAQLSQRVAALEAEMEEAHRRLENQQVQLADALARLKRERDSDSDDVKPVVKKEKK